MSPPIQVFLTTIAMQPVLRQRQEYILRILQAKKIPFTSYDVASDESAKRLWRRKAPSGNAELPGILVGGTCPGTFQDFEEAVEFAELDRFLRLNEPWDEDLAFELAPPLPQQAIAVPGAQLPSQTQPLANSSSSSLRPPGSGYGSGYGAGEGGKRNPRSSEQFEQDLDSLDVTDDQIAELLESLGLENEGKETVEGSAEAKSQEQPKGFGALGGEAARLAKERTETRKVSSSSAFGTAPLAVKPLAVRKVSGTPLRPAPTTSSEPTKQEPETKKPEPTPSSDVDPAAPPVSGEGQVTTNKVTEDELAPSGFEAKEVQAA